MARNVSEDTWGRLTGTYGGIDDYRASLLAEKSGDPLPQSLKSDAYWLCRSAEENRRRLPELDPLRQHIGCGKAPLEVSYVVDGDTFELTTGGFVQLLQVDAPAPGDDCYGEEARATLRKLLPLGRVVQLIRDPELDNTDNRGRFLRYVFVGKRNINLTLVQKGAAIVSFEEGRGRYAKKLVAAAQQAKAKARGVWGACE